MLPNSIIIRRSTAFIRYALPCLFCAWFIALLPRTVLAQAPIIVETTGQSKPTTITATKPKPNPLPPPKPAEPRFVPPRMLWKTLVQPVEGGTIYNGDALYLGGGTSLYKLDSDGRTQWTVQVGEQRSTAAFDDRRVFFGNEKGILYAFTQRSGTPLWQFASESGAAIQNPPAVGAGHVFVECLDNNIYTLNAGNGQLVWKYTRADGAMGYSAPIYDDKAVYVAGETTLYKLDAITGKELWKAYVGGKSLSTPALTDTMVIVGGDGTGVTAFARDSGKVIWNFSGKIDNDGFGAPLVVANRVYVGTYQRNLYALDTLNGAPRWTGKLTGSSLTRPTLDARRNILYLTCLTYRGEPSAVGFSTVTGRRVWDYSLDVVTGAPLVVGDRLYIGSTNGYLYAFSLK